MAVARVLILDDEPLIAMLLHNWLEELGYEPIGPANTVAQAVALIENDRPDAAILDVSLHKDDCYSLADALKTRNIPFAFGTGRNKQMIAPRHAEVPMLSKPYDQTALELVMSELLPGRGFAA
jgi:CheY-like chemotaxis protein